jgi:hypothetical protein
MPIRRTFVYHCSRLHWQTADACCYSERFTVPKLYTPFGNGSWSAKKFRSACPQQLIAMPSTLIPAQEKLQNDLGSFLGRSKVPLDPSEDCKSRQHPTKS